MPLQSSSCLDKHVCSGDYLNDDSLQQARAPYHTKPQTADLGLGMQIRQEAAFPAEGRDAQTWSLLHVATGRATAARLLRAALRVQLQASAERAAFHRAYACVFVKRDCE